MLSLWRRTFGYSGQSANLEDLQRQVVGRLALMITIGGFVAAWSTLPFATFRGDIFVFCTLVGLLGVGVKALSGGHSRLARHLMVWGLNASLVLALYLFDSPWLPFAGTILVFINAFLVAGSEVLTALMQGGAAFWLWHSGQRSYPMPELLGMLGGSAGVAWLCVHMVYMAQVWAWVNHQRSVEMMDLARDRQAELSRLLKSLDVTTGLLQRTQTELIHAHRQAEEARRLKERFAANISHELRTPLNLILGFSEMMYLSPEAYGEVNWSPALRGDIHQIYRSSRHLLDMIDDVLDLSRLESRGFILEKELTDLEPLVRDAVDIVADLFRSRSIQLEVQAAPDLPAVLVDPTRIRQVLLNLLNNAARFTAGGVVRVEAHRIDGEVHLSVSDTGRGIPKDDLVHLFDEFYQVDHSLHRSHEGAGLGLAICKSFVEAHDGRIWVESHLNVGSTFHIALPVPDHHVPILRPRLNEPLADRPENEHPVLLVVDSDPSVAELVRRNLPDYETVSVRDARRVRGQVEMYHPRLVVWNLAPGQSLNGDALPALPVPHVTCSLPSRTWMRDRLKVRSCLTKPVTAQQLAQQIDALGRARDVLIVDDNRGFCQLVERMLTSTHNHCRLRQAWDGEEGVRAMRQARPDVVLLDLIMPGMDGFQVLETMQNDADLRRIPVIALTASSFAEDALAQRGNQVVIQRREGLNAADTLRCIQAIAGVLEPHYDERTLPRAVLKQPRGGAKRRARQPA